MGHPKAPPSAISISSKALKRALAAAVRSLPKLPADIRDEVAKLLTLRNMALIGAATTVWLASHAVGVGFAVDILLVGVGVISLGSVALRAAAEFELFWKTAVEARSDADLDRAAAYFARAITTVGVNAVVVLLLRRGGQTEVSEQSLEGWTTFIDGLELRAGDRGALWSKVKPDLAEALARQDGRVTLESLLRETGFWGRYKAEFGDAKTELTERIWELVSRKYAASLEGRVAAYVDDVELFRYITASPKVQVDLTVTQGDVMKGLPQITAELEQISTIMEDNSRISSVILKDVKGGPSVTMTRDSVRMANAFVLRTPSRGH